jgi:hypothetical protein
MDEDYPVLPQFLKFKSSQGLCAAGCEWNADAQCLELTDLSEESPGQMTHPDRLRWKAFWLLLDLAGVWKWEPAYAPEDGLSCDEHQWSLMVSKDGRFISTCGNEAYPGTQEKHYEEGSPYDVLRTAVEILTCRHYDSSMLSDEALTSIPHSFDFTLWSDAYENLGVNIRWRKNGPGLQWQHVSNHEDEWVELPSPSRLNWKAFCFLMELAKVEKWDAEYASFTTAHTGWSFKAYIKSQTIKSAGGDTYPNSEEGAGYLPGSPFDILLTSLSLLVGKDILGMRH